MNPAHRTFTLPSGYKLRNVHAPTECLGRLCVIHNPIPDDHPHASWYLNWRWDRVMFERICPHGVGHPAVEQIAYWEATLSAEDAEAQVIHGCCGCCWVET